MSLFGAIGIAGTGVTVYRKWLDAVSDNIANISTARPTSQPAFQERFVVAAADQAGATSGYELPGGVQVGGIALGSATGRVVYDPNSPLADAQGLVRYPSIDLGDQMTSLLLAQRGYQANLAVVERAKEAYDRALELGR
jgi:flagellar basal-body rod protein FlgC